MQVRHSAPSSQLCIRLAVSCSHNLKVSSLQGREASHQCCSQTEHPLEMQKPLCLHHKQILINKPLFFLPSSSVFKEETKNHTHVHVNLETDELCTRIHEA